MALDRQSIEKKDFPIGRRGYEPEAVDAHLAALSREVEQLSSPSKKRGGNLATVASEQIRSIIEAAEQTAAEIERQAEEDAREVRHDADEEARKIRGDASAQAKEHVENVSGASSGLQTRIDAMEKELSELLSTLRTGANRVTADLSVLQENLGVLRAAAGSDAAARPVDTRGDLPSSAAESVAPPVDLEPEEPAVGVPLDDPAVAGAEPALEPEPALQPDPALEPDPAAGPESDDVEGARLVALNMALNGSPREETEAYLAEHYSLPDRSGLLEEVYSTVEG